MATKKAKAKSKKVKPLPPWLTGDMTDKMPMKASDMPMMKKSAKKKPVKKGAK